MYKSSRIVILTAVFIIINIVSSFLFYRFDLTEGQIYTLSDSTREIIGNLDKPLEIKAFISQDLPPQFVTTQKMILDRLNEYEQINPFKLKVVYHDPVTDDEAAALAQNLGIPSLDLQVVEKDQAQVVKAYFGLAVLKEKESPEESENPLSKYEDIEVLPVIQNIGGLEYELASMLLKVGSSELKTVGFLSGHGEHTIAQANQYGMASSDPRADYQLGETLGRNYDLRVVEFTPPAEGQEPVNPLSDIDTLIVAGPTENLPAEQIAAINQFFADGHNAIFLIDAMTINTQTGFSASTLRTNFNDLLANWGIKVESKLLADAVHDFATFNQGYVTYSLPYPFFAKVSDLSDDNSITQDIENIILPWSSPLTIDDKEEVKVEVLGTSSKQYQLFNESVIENDATVSAEGESDTPTEIQTIPIDLDPQQNFNISAADSGPVPLIALAQKEGEGKVVVVGDSDFVSQVGGNQVFLLNAVDSLTLGDTLISIRSKGITDRPLEPTTDSTKNLMRWGMIIGLPALFIIYGFYRKYQRRQLKAIKF